MSLTRTIATRTNNHDRRLDEAIIVQTKEGRVYVSCLLDLFTYEIKGLAVDSRMRASVVMDGVRMIELRAGITRKRGAAAKKGPLISLPQRKSICLF